MDQKSPVKENKTAGFKKFMLNMDQNNEEYKEAESE